MAKLDWEKARRHTQNDYNRRNQIGSTKRHTRTYNAIADRVMPYGKYKGYAMEALPQDYLDWAVKNMGNHLELIKQLDREWLRRHKRK